MKADFKSPHVQFRLVLQDKPVSVDDGVRSIPPLASRENTFQVRASSLVSWQIRCVSALAALPRMCSLK